MNIYSSATTSARLTCLPAHLTNLPSSIEITDAWGSGGSGMGNGSSALISATGEFYERRHFYTDVIPDVVGGLCHSLGKMEISRFVQAFHQTSEHLFTDSDLISHKYNLSEVLRTSDLSRCHIPTACIALSTVRTETENSIYPLRDTCGCAFGWHPEQAVLGSIKEFLERQFLARFWLTSYCAHVIDAKTAAFLLKGTCVETLCKALSTSGELTFIDISDTGYPGVCILAVYGQPNSQHNVRYCAGMAYADSIELAVKKSLLELWQTYRFIDLFVATEQKIEDIHDPYLKHFLSCNHYQTYRDITSVHAQTLAPVRTHPEALGLKHLLRCLTRCKVLGYIYLKMIPIEEHFGYVCKFISPDFFMHMNNSRNINLKNPYSNHFFTEIQSNRKEHMVPFP